jgi:hypothetical protein
VAVVLVGGFFAVRSVTVDEAERDTRDQVAVLARLVESAGLTDGVVRGDRRSLAKLDDVVQSQVLSKWVVRVKVWTEDGKILYSDEPALIGQRFELGEGRGCSARPRRRRCGTARARCRSTTMPPISGGASAVRIRSAFWVTEPKRW